MGQRVLGVDLGANSVGVALIDVDEGCILHTAVRVFPEGMEGSDKDWENGKEQSRAQKRREARMQRRQFRRRQRRLLKIFHCLQRYGLLPLGQPQETLNQLDRELSNLHQQHSVLPYFLRARALDHPLMPHELGRALYHLAQRRGFVSNRKTAPKTDEDAGRVKETIRGLWAEMASAGSRTLGEHLAKQDPHHRRLRGGACWTHRDMYKQEFEAIWNAQAPHHPVLTPARHDELFHAMFYQRPLKDQSWRVGECDLERGQKRAPLRLLEVQRFRYFDALNNLRLYTPEFQLRPFTPEERARIVCLLESQEKVTFAAIKKLIGAKSCRFSIEEGGEKQIPGNATAARISAIVPVLWASLSEPQRADFVEDIGDGDRNPTDEDVERCAREKWSLTEDESRRLSEIRLPQDHASYSLAAIRKLLPLLEQGMATGAARFEAFPEQKIAAEPQPSLAPVSAVRQLKQLRNPAVLRSLSELRKMANAVIHRYGKPDYIHVELARELRRNKKDRMELTQRNRKNEKGRELARAELLKHGIARPSRDDIEKYLLWQECGTIDPYSGEEISLQALFDQPRFEVEHIIPFSRSLDNTFQNKTLCRNDFNKQKGNRTPHEVFGGAAKWDEILERVRKSGNRKKLLRFQMTETDEDKLLGEFTERQLTDTKYASKLAAQYVGTLYGGIVDAAGTKRVVTCAGEVTAYLRRAWNLNRILSETPEKSREDHRHHAVDAVAVALASHKWIKALSDFSKTSLSRRPLANAVIPDPWPGFRDEVRTQILERTVVSHRPEKKLYGALHEETIYGKPRLENGKQVVHVRKPVVSLTTRAAIEEIVDPIVRESVMRHFGICCEDSRKFSEDPPRLPSGVPIKKVRIRRSLTTVTVGAGARQRSVATGDNHHMEVVAELGKDGKPKRYRGIVVSRLDALRRFRNGKTVIQKDHGPGFEFCFTLREGDMVEFAPKGQSKELWRVRGVSVESNGRLDLSKATDARLKSDIIKFGPRERPSANQFMKQLGWKVQVSPLGDVSQAHD